MHPDINIVAAASGRNIFFMVSPFLTYFLYFRIFLDVKEHRGKNKKNTIRVIKTNKPA